MDNGLSLQKLQTISNIACFSLNYQQKLEAEQYFLQIGKNITSPLILQILNYGSDTLIFVTIQYVNKLIEDYPLQFLKQIFNVVQGQVSNWYIPDAHQFRRRVINSQNSNINMTNNNTMLNGLNTISYQSKQITKYVMNSISFFMSNCMKRFFIQDDIHKRNQIVEWINQKQNQRYKLWLYTIFIQNISQIDQSMGFMKFRSLSYNFQQQVIPTISKCIIPFLYRVQDIMKVNEISGLQQQLNVEQNNILASLMQKQQKIFQNQNQFKFAQLVFQLLHSLVFYNFHLTYTQYEQESSFDNCLICFPQEFTNKVVNEEFIESIGYVIDRLIDTMPQSKFLKTTLQCLQKIFLTKLSYVDDHKKLSFIKQCTIMLTKCLNKQNLDKFILTKLMVCNNKFLNNVQITYLKQKKQLKGPFHEWLLTVTKTTFIVLQNIQLAQQFNFNLQQSLIIQCLQLYQKIVGSICAISYSPFQQVAQNNQQRQYVQNNVKMIVQILIKKLLIQQNRPLIQQSTAEIFKTNILQIKTFCQCFFNPFKQLASLNYEFLFQQILNNMDFALNSQTISVKFNLFMFLCQIMDRNYLQRNIVMVKCQDEAVFTLSKCVNKVLKFLKNYLKNKNQVILNQQIILMDISILIFFDKILSQFLGYFQNHQHIIEIKQKIFLNILKLQNNTAFNANQSQQFILFCVQSVLSFLLIYNKNNDSSHINDFIFQTINRILMKFKWGIKRQVFKSSHIYARLEQFFTQVQKETNIKPVLQCQGISINLGLFHQFQRLKWRKKLLKVIALLYFDDIIDDYRRNLQTIFISLKNEHILTILLDIQGIGQAIDTISIYKAFLQMTEKYFSIQSLTNQLVQFASSFTGFDKLSQKYPKVKIIKQVIKMHRAILSNKGQRIGNPKNMQSIYYMIKGLIKYWIEFLKMSTSEQWIPVVRQVIKVINQLIKCDKINFYLIQRVSGQEYVEFMYEMFMKMLEMSQNIQENPKFYEAYLTTLVQISREILEVIFFPSLKIKTIEFNQKNKEISQTYLRIFLGIFKKIPKFLQQLKVGNVKNEAYLQKSLQIVKFTISFIDYKKRQQLSYRQQMVQITVFIQQMKQLIFQFTGQILAYLTTDKHMSVHRRTLIIVLYQCAIIYPQLLEVLIGGMNLPGYLIQQVKQCLQYVKKQQQQLFIDRFKTWLRMIHMSQQQVHKHKQQNKDFYSFMGIL